MKAISDQPLKNFSGQLFYLIRQSQIVLGAGGALLAAQTYRVLYLQSLPFDMVAFIFFSIVAAYTFIGLKVSTDGNKVSVELRQSSVVKVIIAWVSCAGTLFLFFQQDKAIQSLAAILFVCTLAYMTPIFINQEKIKGLRDVFILKSAWLALVWSVATVLIPAVHIKGFDFGKIEVLYFVQRFFFILAVAVVFNIRDHDADLKRKMRTIATIAGVQKTRIIAMTLLLISLAVFLFINNSILLTAFGLAVAYTLALTLMAKPASKNFFYVILMDGTLLMQGLMLLWVAQ